jgi:hypothetical protein
VATEPHPENPTGPARRTKRVAGRPSPAMVIWGSIALFAVLFALLTYQLSVPSGPSQRPVLVRKVVKRRVVTTVVPTPGSTSVSSGPVTTSAPEASSYGVAPVTTGAS